MARRPTASGYVARKQNVAGARLILIGHGPSEIRHVHWSRPKGRHYESLSFDVLSLRAGDGDVLRRGQWLAGQRRQGTLPASRTWPAPASYRQVTPEESDPCC